MARTVSETTMFFLLSYEEKRCYTLQETLLAQVLCQGCARQPPLALPGGGKLNTTTHISGESKPNQTMLKSFGTVSKTSMLGRKTESMAQTFVSPSKTTRRTQVNTDQTCFPRFMTFMSIGQRSRKVKPCSKSAMMALFTPPVTSSSQSMGRVSASICASVGSQVLK